MYKYIRGHYLLIYLFIHVVFHVFFACLKFVCIPVVPGPRRGGSLSGASTNEQLVVEMPIKGHGCV